MEKGRALFLDRDGTVIHDLHYLADPEKVSFLPGVHRALITLQQKGYALVSVSNQSGIGRGIITEEQARSVEARILAEFRAAGVGMTGSYVCPHAPEEGCACRKPLPGMLLQAARDLDLDLSQSWMIGDKMTDVAAGTAAGCRTVLINRKHGDRDLPGLSAEFTCRDWDETCAVILRRES